MAKGLKESKKWSVGSIHENGGGKFEILERWFDEDTNSIMLKYKFLENGRVEENKEDNVNSSEWKWKKVRGLTGKTENQQSGESNYSSLDLEEHIEDMYERVEKLFAENGRNVNNINANVSDIQKTITEMMSIIKVQQKQIDALISDRGIINKLLEKI